MILSACQEAKLKDMRQVETFAVDQLSTHGSKGENLYVHSSVYTVSKNSGFARQSLTIFSNENGSYYNLCLICHRRNVKTYSDLTYTL